MPRAGLDAAAVTAAAAALADEVGLDGLRTGLVAQRLGVEAPSPYNHVENLADLTPRTAVLAADELGEALREAIQGRPGSDALAAAAATVRAYVTSHPGRYAAGNGVRPRPGDALTPAIARTLAPFSAVLPGYGLDPAQEIHALRLLRSWLHGFATLEVEGGFRFDTDVDESFRWSVQLLDLGLQAARDRHAPG